MTAHGHFDYFMRDSYTEGVKNSELMELCSCVLRMQVANNSATDNCLIFGDVCFIGKVLATISSESLDFSMFS